MTAAFACTGALADEPANAGLLALSVLTRRSLVYYNMIYYNMCMSLSLSLYMYVYIYIYTFIFIEREIYTNLLFDSEGSFCGPDGTSLRGALEAGGP